MSEKMAAGAKMPEFTLPKAGVEVLAISADPKEKAEPDVAK